MKKLFFPLVILLIFSFIMTSCGGDTTTTTSPAATTTTTTSSSTAVTTTTTTTSATTGVDKYGGILRSVTPYSPSKVPGWVGDTSDPQVMQAGWIIFEPLVKPLADGSMEPFLATGWEWGPDNAYITFTLRDDVTFHDGTPFNADAVKTQVDQLLLEEHRITINWDSCEVISDYEVRLNLKLYETDFWTGMYSIAMMFVSPTGIKEHGIEWVKENPIGTGPFKYKSFEKDVSLVGEKFDDYWQEGKPYVDELRLLTVKENLTQRMMLESGEADAVMQQQGKFLKDFQDLGYTVVTMYGGTNMLIFDTANEGSIYNDVNVRMAIEHAINKQEMADALGYGFMIPTNQVSPPDNPSHNHDLPSRDYDPEKAKQLLADAGYPNGVKMSTISDPSGTDIALYLQQYLAEVGVELELQNVDNAKYWNYCMAGWNDAFLNAGYAVGTNLPSWWRSYFPPRGIFDVSCKIPDDILAKINDAMVQTDPDVFEAMSNEVAQMIYDDCTVVPMFSNAMGNVIQPDVHDSGFYSYIDFSVWDPADVWIEK